ncbi:hypothetical protein RB195_003047 [Necator americanus]|uniref:Iojap-like protein n=1 Tax=Necator americanus TaxID=51031 RepID=A0ABR1DLS9_NECAM
MDSMHLMSLRLSRWMRNIGPSWNRGFAMSRFTPILLRSSPSNTHCNVKSKEKYIFRPLSTSQEKIEAQKSKIKQSQEYFDQYIEEYYDYDEEEEDTPVKHEVVEEQLNVESLDDLVSLLRRERAYDIVVIALGADGPGIVDTMVICTPFNTRHGAAVAEVLRKAGKQTDEQPRKYTVRHNFGWFQIELGKIQVHVMGEETRQRFDLETLWGVNDVVEEEEDIPLIPPPKEKSS